MGWVGFIMTGTITTTTTIAYLPTLLTVFSFSLSPNYGLLTTLAATPPLVCPALAASLHPLILGLPASLFGRVGTQYFTTFSPPTFYVYVFSSGEKRGKIRKTLGSLTSAALVGGATAASFLSFSLIGLLVYFDPQGRG
ncbi:hypothetical protein B0T24DRAFT_627215, partial [Lasiosphaeria ovina]